MRRPKEEGPHGKWRLHVRRGAAESRADDQFSSLSKKTSALVRRNNASSNANANANDEDKPYDFIKEIILPLLPAHLAAAFRCGDSLGDEFVRSVCESLEGTRKRSVFFFFFACANETRVCSSDILDLCDYEKKTGAASYCTTGACCGPIDAREARI
jgi:hypothetical protein